MIIINSSESSMMVSKLNHPHPLQAASSRLVSTDHGLNAGLGLIADAAGGLTEVLHHRRRHLSRSHHQLKNCEKMMKNGEVTSS